MGAEDWPNEPTLGTASPAQIRLKAVQAALQAVFVANRHRYGSLVKTAAKAAFAVAVIGFALLGAGGCAGASHRQGQHCFYDSDLLVGSRTQWITVRSKSSILPQSRLGPAGQAERRSAFDLFDVYCAHGSSALPRVVV